MTTLEFRTPIKSGATYIFQVSTKNELIEIIQSLNPNRRFDFGKIRTDPFDEEPDSSTGWNTTWAVSVEGYGFVGLLSGSLSDIENSGNDLVFSKVCHSDMQKIIAVIIDGNDVGRFICHDIFANSIVVHEMCKCKGTEIWESTATTINWISLRDKSSCIFINTDYIQQYELQLTNTSDNTLLLVIKMSSGITAKLTPYLETMFSRVRRPNRLDDCTTIEIFSGLLTDAAFQNLCKNSKHMPLSHIVSIFSDSGLEVPFR